MRSQQNLRARRAGVALCLYLLRYHALTIRTGSVNEELQLRILNGMQQTVHVGIYPRTAGTVTEAYEMCVAIPHLCRIDTFPRPAYEFMTGQRCGNGQAEAGIDEAWSGQ